MKPAHIRTSIRCLALAAACAASPAAWTQQVVKTIAAGNGPREIAVNPVTNRWYMASQDGTFVGDGATGAVITLINPDVVASPTRSIAIDPSTNRIYTTDASDRLVVIDGSDNSITRTPLGFLTFGGIALNPVTQKVYIPHRASNKLTIWNATAGSAITALDMTGPGSVAVNTVTNKVYVASATAATITVIDGSANTASAPVTLPGVASAIAVDAVNNRIWAASATAGGDILAIDGTTLAATPHGTCPNARAVAINPATNTVYASCGGSNYVLILDGGTGAILATVPVDSSPSALAVDVVANRVYVVDELDDSVTIIDGATYATNTLPVGAAPISLAVNPVTGKVFVSSVAGKSVSVIDRSTWTQTPVPNGQAVAVNPVTGKIYIADYNSSHVSVLDAFTGATLASPDAGLFGASAIAVDPVANKVYVSTENGRLAIVNGATDAYVTTLTLESGSPLRSIAVNPLTHRVYVGNRFGNDVKVVDGVTNAALTPIITGGGVSGVAMNVGTGRVFASVESGNYVSVIDAATDTLLKNVPVGAGPVAIDVNRVTNRIYTANPNGFDVSEIVGSTLGNPSPTVNSFPLPGNPNGVAVNPVTNKVWVSVGSATNAYVIDPVAVTLGFASVSDPYSTGIAVDPVRNRVYVTRNFSGNLSVIDGATLASQSFGIGASPGTPVVDPVTGKVYVPRFSNGAGPVVLVDPAPTTFTNHRPVPTLAGGTMTSNTNANLSVTTCCAYTPNDPQVRKVLYRVGDSQGAHSNGSGTGPFTAALSGLSKGLNYVSLFATDGMMGSSTSTEADTSGATATLVGAPTVFAFVLVDPPSISTTSLPDATAGTAYSQSLAASGGVGALAFTVTAGVPPPGVTLATNGAITGTPTAGGTFAFTATVTDASGGSSATPLSITVAAFAVISASPPSLSFAGQALGSPSAAQSVTVGNTGYADLVVGTPTITGTNAGDFSVSSNNCTTVPATQSCVIQVTSTPTAVGARTASLNIPSNDPGTPTKVVGLSGTGVDLVPDAFVFTDVTGVARSSVQTSNTITVSGVSDPTAISVTGGAYSIGCTATFVTSASTISNGETVCVRHTASASYGTATNTTLTIGGISDTFTSTTIQGFTLTAAMAGNGAGTMTGTGINCPGDCSEQFDAGTSVTVTATPSVGSAYFSFGGCDTLTFNQCTVTMNGNRTVTATFTSQPVAATDFNADGKGDILYRNTATGQVYRMLMNGFTVTDGAMVYSEPNTAWSIIADGDSNHDGVADLLWRNSSTGQVYEMPFNAGGMPNGGAIIYTEPNAAWQIILTPDLNGDGNADLLWWNSSTGDVYGMLQNGTSTIGAGFIYTEPNTAWKIVAVGDFTGSGKRNQLIYRNSGNGQVYMMTVTFAAGAFSQSGAMIYQEPNTDWRIIGAPDLNGDGKSDLLWRNVTTGQVYGMLMNGAAIATQGMIYVEPNTAWKVVAWGDYSGDGKADLLWRNDSTGQVYMMIMNGLAISQSAMVYQEANTTWKILGPWEYGQSSGVLVSAPNAGAETKSTLVGTPSNAGRITGEPLNASPGLWGEPVNRPLRMGDQTH